MRMKTLQIKWKSPTLRFTMKKSEICFVQEGMYRKHFSKIVKSNVIWHLPCNLHIYTTIYIYTYIQLYTYICTTVCINTDLNVNAIAIRPYFFFVVHVHCQDSTLTLTRSPLESKIDSVESEKCQLTKNTCPIRKVIFYSLERRFWCSNRLVEN